MPNIILKLIVALIVAALVSYIPFDARIKQVCYLIIGIVVLLLLLSFFFGWSLGGL